MKDTPVCPSCGAALPPDAERCDLCGTELDAASAPDVPEPEDALVEATQPPSAAHAPDPQAAPPSAPLSNGPVQCMACGHVNPPWSRFCNQCAAPLSAVAEPVTPVNPAPAAGVPEGPAVTVAPGPPSAPTEGGVRPPSDPGRRALLLVGVGVAAVLLLYFVTQRSQGPAEPEAPAAAEDGDAPRLTPAPAALPGDLAEQVAALEDEGTPQSLDDAGGLLYRAAAALPPEDPQRSALAQQAVALYERSLALEDDPDVRVNLAVASELDGRNPMRPVQELQAVLAQNPDHPEANFNMGLKRMQIGRLDDAAESFRRAIANSSPGTLIHTSATDALAAVEGALRQQPATGTAAGS
jgi:hypothetical protein